MYGLCKTAIALTSLVWAAGPAELHITPTVEIVPLAKAVHRLLPGAKQFYLRDIQMSKQQVAAVDSLVKWVPEEKQVKFYVGRDAGRELGSVEWIKVDSRHGPVAVAVRFTPEGGIGGVIVTHATEETVTWVKEVVDAGLLDEFPGKTLVDLDTAMQAVRGQVGRMPAYMGEVIALAVARAAALRQVAYQG
jgi:hypothetical protein